MTTYRPGTYLSCPACGRLLQINWPTRSIVCSCGERIDPSPAARPPETPKKKAEAPRS